MFKFLIQYTKVLVVLLLAMIAYTLLVVPAIEPHEHSKQTALPPPQSLPTEHWWQDFFPADAWQIQSPKIIKTKQGILVAKSFEWVGDKALKLVPLTIIMPQTDAGRAAMQGRTAHDISAEDMWVVSAEQGATVHFEEKPDFTSVSELPTVLRGRLNGAVQITRRSARGPSQQPWTLRTYDVALDRQQVSTQREVVIEWDGSIIQGRDLRIRLRGDLLGSQGTASAWGPLDELKLYHVDNIDVALPPGGIWADMDTQRFKDNPELKTLPARLNAKCGGRFTFDFKSSEGTLQNGVQLVHQLGDLASDKFECEDLVFTMVPPSKTPGPKGTLRRNGSTRMKGIQVASFAATGIDSLRDFVGEKWVELRAPTIDVSARAKVLKVDLEEKRIVLDGRLDQPGSTKSSVLLTYEGNEFRSPRIEYKAAPRSPETTDGASRHLGWLVAAGPGELKSNGDGRLESFTVRWEKQLKMAPAPAEGLPEGLMNAQWIELTGNTLIESKEHGFLASDRFEAWLVREGVGDQSADMTLISAGQQSLQGTASSAGEASRFVPKRLYASGTTVLSTSSIKAQVAELDLAFAFLEERSVADTPVEGLALSDSAGRPMHQWVRPPDDLQAGSVTTNADTEAVSLEAPQEPISVSGKKLTASMVIAGEQNWIDQLQIQGPVEVWRDTSNQIGAMPWKVVGDLLMLATNRVGEADLQVEGKPAKVLVADGYLQGPTIRINQTHNLVLIDQPGEFTIPKQALIESKKSGGSKIEWFDAPRCLWKGRMIFDGAVARLEGGVEFYGGLRSPQNEFWRFGGTAKTLEVVLAEKMSFNETNGFVADMERIVLRDDVNILASQVDQEGTKLSRTQLVLPSLTMHMLEEQVVGAGPGWIKSRFLADELDARQSPGQLATGSSKQENGLQAAHLIFRDSLVGFLSRKELVFDGNVQLATGPITDWEQSIDVREAQVLKKDNLHLDADQIKVYDTSGLSSVANRYGGPQTSAVGTPPATWEFQAIGNIAFNALTEAGEYRGTGYRATYVQANELLTFTGDGRRPAYVEHLPSDNSKQRWTARIKSVRINPKTKEVTGYEPGGGGAGVHFDEPNMRSNGNFVPSRGGQNGGFGSGMSSPSSRVPPNPRDAPKQYLDPNRR